MPLQCDHTADANKSEFVKFAHVYGDLFPDFLKEASEDVFVPQPLEARLYADTDNQQFPCDSKVNTYLSALYYQEKRALFNPQERARIDRRLSGFANHFGIKEAVAALVQRQGEMSKTAAVVRPDSDYAYLNKDKGERRMLISTPLEVQKAAQYLETHRDQFSFEDRHKTATRIMRKAAEFGAHLTNREFIEKQAGMGLPNPERVWSMLKQRSQHLGAHPPLQQAFDKMAEEIKTSPRTALQPDALVKLAHTIDLADTLTGHAAQYKNGYARPEDILFEQTYTKIAEDSRALTTLTTGRTYEKKAFLRVPLSDVGALFGEDFAAQVSTNGQLDIEKFAELAETLPSGDAVQLEGIFSTAGVTPLFHEKAAGQANRPPAEYLAELARSYVPAAF